ncbi:MAG: NADH-quinone oxidoreductase subunit C [Elusimicrobiales bacterium]|nr:NADH-quinone oxidoreductase subunit C [Elusimicrobiales bacterium]HOJ87194.1 NADH-quinone oxidoreductase subunit C [Elusimicrobiales bacterium]HOL63576.1 NADH-quinone oxidoreductase subunit C [Elusimicrobiales bacterium]HPO95055.1 NADH-quinone oxidoreductase subunit C [Elusimicrobiales bacterium]
MIENLKHIFGNKIIDYVKNYDIDTLVAKKEALIQMISFLKNEEKFDFLMDLFAIDYLGYPDKKFEHRYEIVYNLYSFENNKRLILKVPVTEENPSVDSIVSFYSSADWYEREAYDMYGIVFNGHPNLKRILMYEEFQGHPLRKDYPLKKRQPRIDLK